MDSSNPMHSCISTSFMSLNTHALPVPVTPPAVLAVVQAALVVAAAQLVLVPAALTAQAVPNLQSHSKRRNSTFSFWLGLSQHLTLHRPRYLRRKGKREEERREKRDER